MLYNILEFCDSVLKFDTFSNKKLFMVMYFHCHSNQRGTFLLDCVSKQQSGTF